MEPIVTLYERESVSSDTLPSTLATLYGGGLYIPAQVQSERPYIIANFVETIDGVVSYNAPGQTGGGVISGDNKQDQMVMGLLRAYADAVIFGSSSLREDAGHVRIPSFIAPPFAVDYEAMRRQLGKREQYPISVIMTASGRVDLNEPTFHTPGLRTIIATTQHGYGILKSQHVPEGTEVRVIETQDNEHSIPPESVLHLLAHDYDLKIALYEGGPTLLASFLAAHSIDELFVTFAPQIAGHSRDTQRLSLVEGYAFSPENAPWATLLSVKQAYNHLLLRYKFADRSR
jgi:riboflavin biosynthesis pyrimidine reductase